MELDDHNPPNGLLPVLNLGAPGSTVPESFSVPPTITQPLLELSSFRTLVELGMKLDSVVRISYAKSNLIILRKNCWTSVS